MRIAIIDLGTNSVRFDVHQLGPGRRVRQLHREKLMIRLGQGVFLEGKLDRDAISRTTQAFLSFQRTAADLKADKIIAFGTSALREASDGERLLNLIRKKTGIDVRVISGIEEAKLIAEGVLANETVIPGKFALIDIGGGSTEISVCRGKEVLHSASFPLGTARLQQIFLKSSPPRAATKKELSPIDQLRRYIKSTVLPQMIAEEWPKVDKIFGSSGTIRAIGRILKKTNGSKAMDFKELQRLNTRIATMTTTQLLGIAGLESKRVDMILAGAILLEECMLAFRAKRAFTTDFSLRDGILQEEIQLHSERKASHIALHFDELYEKATRLGCSEAHLKQVVSISEDLFDLLKPLHKLKVDWKSYLTAAAILHDTGEAVSPTRHELHSYYVVKNADFASMEKWESEFVAQLCLWHRGGKLTPNDLAFTKQKLHKQAFKKLLAIIRVADALDRGHKSSVKVKSVKITRKEITLNVTGKNSIDLELLRIDQKKVLFEEVFGRKLNAARAR